MRIALIVWVGLAAACKQLPDIPVGVCGNHILEPGEDCDSGDDPNCAPPGTPDACHLKCGSGCAAGEICAVSGFCRPTPNVCGNQIVEAGEDCDAPADPNCGAPGSDKACRFLCGMAACPSGYFCGRDQICRTPVGTYTLGASAGASNSLYGLLDVNADGFPDLVERGLSELTIRTNDQHAGFVPFGDGPVHLLSGYGAVPGIDTPQAPLANQPLFAAETKYGIELLAVVPGKHLQPLVAVTALLPGAVTLKQFQGTIRRDPLGGAEALYFDPVSHTLETTTQRKAARAMIVVTGVAALVVVAAGAVWGQAESSAGGLYDQQRRSQITPGQLAEYNSDRARRDTWRTGTFVALGITGALAVTTTGLFLFDQPRPPSAAPR